MATPNKNKMAILTWLVVYPLITALLAVLEPLLSGIPMPLRSFVLTVIMVPAMVYLIMPTVTSKMSAWLNSN
ncbi:hypothetical protein [uncultured Roseibium sp.]|uniref:hypothetical protein n=1 Tax=uncultured Roseibium sp. TaxID=1936171 RepID=UPI0026323302|nr:hypothetical protein [uncultured Roseibium sp.]